MHMNPKDAVRLSTVCKEWSIMAQRYNPTMNKIPWLVNVEYAKGVCNLRSVVDENMSFKIRFDFPLDGSFISSSSHGWLVLENDTISLYNPFSRAWLHLPTPQHPVLLEFVYMSSAPTDPNCIVLARDVDILYAWRSGDESWTIEKDVNISDYSSILRFQGQFYALHYSRHLVCFEVFPFRLMDLNGQLPNVFSPIYFFEIYLVESCEEMLLVGINRGQEVYQFRFDWKNKSWIKMESLGDRALFLYDIKYGNHGILVSTLETECRGNCIYLIDYMSLNVYVIENQNMRISMEQPKNLCIPVWISPSSS